MLIHESLELPWPMMLKKVSHSWAWGVFLMLLRHLFVVHSLRTYYLVTCLILKFVILTVAFLTSLYIMDTDPQSDVWLVNIFFALLQSTFSFEWWYPLLVRSFLASSKVSLINCWFYCIPFTNQSPIQKFLSYPNELKHIPCFLFYSIQVSSLMIRSFIHLELEFV